MNKIRYNSALFTLISASSPKALKRVNDTVCVTAVSFTNTYIFFFVSNPLELKYFRSI